MRAKIAIVSPALYIEKEINKIIIREFNDILAKIIPGIEEDINTNLKPLFEESETFKEMTTELSNLNVEIGIPANEAKIKWFGIFDILANQIQIKLNKLHLVGNKIDGGIVAEIIESDFKEIIDSNFGSFITEKGFELKWQEWLLIDGDSIIIADHHVRLVNPLKPSKYFFSRTGGAIMVKRGTWKVPTVHKGTIDDNWITRIVQTYFSFIEKFIYRSFKTRLENEL